MVDKQKVEQAIRLLLEGIGEDTEREGLKDTPDRIARMCMEIYGGLDEEADHHLAKQFEVENNEMVLEKDITFYSMCEHHLMPFYGKAHVAYIPNGKVTGLSKLARTVDVYARRPQIQERLTVQIAVALSLLEVAVVRAAIRVLVASAYRISLGPLARFKSCLNASLCSEEIGRASCRERV